METHKIENAFKIEFANDLINGMMYHGLYGEESELHHSLTIPFIYDQRKIPKEFLNIPIVVTVTDFPKVYFIEPVDDSIALYEYYDPQRYIRFVNHNYEMLKARLLLNRATKAEVLDALTGNFSNFLSWQLKLKKEFIKAKNNL
jgi:hypothetical protein